MKTLLLGEHDNKTLRDSTAKALSCAASLGGEVDLLIAGKGCRAVAEQATQLSGVARVLLVDADAYEHMLAEPVAALDRLTCGAVRRNTGSVDQFRAQHPAAGRSVTRRHADLGC